MRSEGRGKKGCFSFSYATQGENEEKTDNFRINVGNVTHHLTAARNY
jgi:hypothetical protein